VREDSPVLQVLKELYGHRQFYVLFPYNGVWHICPFPDRTGPEFSGPNKQSVLSKFKMTNLSLHRHQLSLESRSKYVRSPLYEWTGDSLRRVRFH